ncbi:uncharacterized protein SPSK_08114 [Sporothrix schenckii 1099-18]|uniref:Uncharacterized protein n=1 Tax=Sporothrix schenckii 1099-18 TaxID=1397361 RepID=A0A0F2MGF7_SPOSC|nr:uncharacterized protein SPSK_08114 [Sporothrix schenckii 1099-18]KJR88712.1 hypothetical protein SPSK_08114 [Sporothrix schenckii 1099-18]
MQARTSRFLTGAALGPDPQSDGISGTKATQNKRCSHGKQWIAETFSGFDGASLTPPLQRDYDAILHLPTSPDYVPVCYPAPKKEGGENSRRGLFKKQMQVQHRTNQSFLFKERGGEMKDTQRAKDWVSLAWGE